MIKTYLTYCSCNIITAIKGELNFSNGCIRFEQFSTYYEYRGTLRSRSRSNLHLLKCIN